MKTVSVKLCLRFASCKYFVVCRFACSSALERKKTGSLFVERMGGQVFWRVNENGWVSVYFLGWMRNYCQSKVEKLVSFDESKSLDSLFAVSFEGGWLLLGTSTRARFVKKKLSTLSPVLRRLCLQRSQLEIVTCLERRGRDSNPRQKLPPVTP